MKRFELLLLIGLALAGKLLPAQPAKPAERPPGRYLFIVETSSAMRRRAGAVQDAVQSLLRSDINGQLRRGDTLGIWTFNEQLYAGHFPLQSWTPESRDAVALAAGTFLKIQRYEKQTRLEGVLPELERVMKVSEKITVLLISAGDKEIPGTLFGREINATHAQWYREMERTRMPFITVLRARKGQPVSRSVSMAPWPVTFPEFPPEPAPVAAARPPQGVPAKKPAPGPAPKPRAPMILDMSQPAKAEANETDKTAIAATGQSRASTPVPPGPATPAAEVQPPEAPQAALLPAPLSKPAESLPATTVLPGPARPVASPPQMPSTPGETPKSESRQPAAAVEAKPTSSSSPTAAAPPPPPEARPAAAQAEPRETASSPSVARAAPALQETPPAPAGPPSQTAVAVPPETSFAGKRLMVAALVLLAVVVGLLILFMRRTRNTAPASLITRSMDRKED